MAFIPGLLKGFGAFAMLTGTADALIGTKMVEVLAGGEFPIIHAVDAVMDSQIRFLGSTWAGFGAIMWWVSNDMTTRRQPLALLLGTVVLGGIGRSLSMLASGHVTPLFLSFIGVELLVPPAIWVALKGSALPTKSQ